MNIQLVDLDIRCYVQTNIPFVRAVTRKMLVLAAPMAEMATFTIAVSIVVHFFRVDPENLSTVENETILRVLAIKTKIDQPAQQKVAKYKNELNKLKQRKIVVEAQLRLSRKRLVFSIVVVVVVVVEVDV